MLSTTIKVLVSRNLVQMKGVLLRRLVKGLAVCDGGNSNDGIGPLLPEANPPS